MKKKNIPLLLSIIILLLPSFVFAGQFKIMRVYEGDSIKAKGNNVEIEVRLVGIDSPENSDRESGPGQPFSRKAKDYLSGLILNKKVDIEDYGLGPSNKILGVIYLDGKNINLEMVKAGLAEVYRGLAPHKFNLIPYWQAEKEARDSKRGMWSLGDKYISPKVWQKTHIKR